jgi:hypothetical protein
MVRVGITVAERLVSTQRQAESQRVSRDRETEGEGVVTLRACEGTAAATSPDTWLAFARPPLPSTALGGFHEPTLPGYKAEGGSVCWCWIKARVA